MQMKSQYQPTNESWLKSNMNSVLKKPSVAALGLGALPLSSLVLWKDTLALDALHITLAQLLVLILLRIWLSLGSSWTLAAPTEPTDSVLVVEEKPTINIAVQSSSAGTLPLEETVQVPEHHLYTNEVLDRTLERFITLVEPESLPLLRPASLPKPNALQLKDWIPLLENDEVLVQLHPSVKSLYAVTAHFKSLPLRDLYELLIAVDVRGSYDSMTEQAHQIEHIGTLKTSCSRLASIDYVSLKGMFPVSAKDLVLLSVCAELPSQSINGKLLRRLVCASSSVEHPSKPIQPGYSRMSIGVSGFLLREDGNQGCILTQITDLSSLGSWIPAKIVTMVTTNLIPKTLMKMASAARTITWSDARRSLSSEEWLPPALGSWHRQVAGKASNVYLPNVDPKGRQNSASPSQSTSPSQARTMSDINSQLRIIVSRLGQLEQVLSDDDIKPKQPSSSANEAPSREGSWWSSFLFLNWFGKRTSNSRAISKRGKTATISDIGLLLRTSFSAGLFGGIIGSSAVALAFMWARRRAR